MKYTLFVDDNFHHMDEEERYLQGAYDTIEAAAAAARRIVDEFLSEHPSARSAAQLFELWAMFGPDPWISPPDPLAFNAREYARQRAEEIFRSRTDHPGSGA